MYFERDNHNLNKYSSPICIQFSEHDTFIFFQGSQFLIILQLSSLRELRISRRAEILKCENMSNFDKLINKPSFSFQGCRSNFIKHVRAFFNQLSNV